MGLLSELVGALSRSEIDWERDFAYPVESHGGHGITVRGVNKGRTTTFIASTDTPDRAGDIVKQDWRLANFRRNPVILDSHDHSKVVGRAVEAIVPRTGDDAGKLIIEVEWDLDSPDPAVRNVGHQHLSGIRKAGSVGFRSGKRTKRNKLPTDHPYYDAGREVETWYGSKELMVGTLYENNELLEFSSTAIPMLPEALQRSLGFVPPGERSQGSSGPASLDRENIARLLAIPEFGAAAIDLLWPHLLEKARHDPQLRRIVRAMADAGPPRGSSGPTGGFFATALSKLEGDES